MPLLLPAPLDQKTCLHCTALAIAPNFDQEKRTILSPASTRRNGTLTLLQNGKRVFGVTCWHVIEAREEWTGKTGEEHSLITAVGQPYLLAHTRFCHLRDRLHGLCSELDLAIIELHPRMPEALGKKPLIVRQERDARDLSYAVALGFPGSRRHVESGALGERLATQCVAAVAEKMPDVHDQFLMRSTLESTPDPSELGGMSGGPVIWVDKDAYGLLGIVYEAMPCQPPAGSIFGDSPQISIHAWRADSDRVDDWVRQHDEAKGKVENWFTTPER